MLKKVLFGFLAFLLASIVYIFFFAKDISVQVSEIKAQQALDAKIASGPIGSLGVDLSINSAVIDFKDNDTAIITTSFTANAFGYVGNVTGNFQSGMRFNSPYVYLDNIEPVNVDIKTDEETKSELTELKSAARKFLDRQRQNTDSDKGKEVIDKIIGQTSEDFQASIIQASYGFFEVIPIYDLNNAGYQGKIASLALKDVTFSEEFATITLSPKQALVKILIMIGSLLLIVAIIWSYIVPFSLTEKIFGKNKFFKP